MEKQKTFQQQMDTEQEFFKAFGKKVKRFRQESDLTQERLSFLANLHRTYVGGIERGERNITLINIKNLADALGVSISELFDFEEAKKND